MRSEPVPPVPGPIVGNGMAVVGSGIGSVLVVGLVSVGLSVGASEDGTALLVEDVVDDIIV